MIVDRRDLDFLLAWLDVDGLLARPRFAAHDRAGVAAVLDLAARLAEQELAPHLRASDLCEPHLDERGDVQVLPAVAAAVRRLAEAGLFATVSDAEHGGLQLPQLVHLAALGLLMAGNLATASFALLTVGNARLIATHGSPAQVEAFARPQIAGAATGTMCLSEPHAGSSLGDIATRAVPDGEDALGRRFRLHGSKMWISGGDQGFTDTIIHLVLAKVAEPGGALPAGSRDISLFVVPKRLPDGTRNDVAVTGLNHKMGYRGLPNCALAFGDGRFAPGGRNGAVGWLVGEPGQGLAQMFTMMNEARIAVGLGAAMLACRGYRLALAYALDRRQGRVPGTAGGEPVPIIAHADVRRMLLAQKALSQGALALVLFSGRLLDDELTGEPDARREAATLLSLLTPIAKSWPSEWAQASLHQALQVLGGAGYTRDFAVEQLYRDNRLNPIHEGTTGIQAIDLVGRKLRRDGGAAFSALAARIRRLVARVEAAGLPAQAQALAGALGGVERAAAVLTADPDERRALAHATPFLFAFGHLVVGWLWLDQTLAARAALADPTPEVDRAFLAGRGRAADFFLFHELPHVAAWVQPILAGSTLALDMPTDQF